ncbi:unnamed protein product [Acanthoscelides obtectus]|uniref:URB1 N-terminal domain-containing protein n=1 Tax=Acanthoscelides obtectus TaxID=200917 RepID=A0A9P0PX63_ACAOB|nr:unnamed protein product [Acanthoscelides obtectus]CAK1679927.1 Nucleolar pre-ribosomal-associated protein 1 [Acanthoscelides obtectus]
MTEGEEVSLKSKKRPAPDQENPNEAKKVKHFNAKEFRKQLNSNSKLQALQDFLNAIKSETSRRDCITDYLQNGGSCIELLQTLEFDSSLPPSLVFEIVAYVILKIGASCAQHLNSSQEACRYLLNNYVAVVNKMINLSSTTPERKACLKLLTAMVTLSPALAKDVLVHVGFHQTNVELLTKHTGEKNSVRDHFIRFLTAFLVDGHYPALSMLLEKKGFITSIVGGLQYDNADTLCMVINAMKNFILENTSVSKTAKMKTFNTTVVRDIVNLYNWKGPSGFRNEKKNKNKSTSFTVDEVEKAKVSECVHDFLLVLCCSHRYGVIFKDHMLGLAKKTQNPLMYTVLESLERPWDHSYASELVTKICGACPDLAKTIWKNLKPSLEPRYSEKWLKAVEFAKNLIKEFHPSCIEFCLKELSPYQIFQVTQCLVAPLPIIQTIIPEQGSFESSLVKNIVLSLILEMLKALELYLNNMKSWLSNEKYEKYCVCINNYVGKNFPHPTIILKDWNKFEEIKLKCANDLIKSSFSIFGLYKKLSPPLLSKLAIFDIKELLTWIETMFQDDTSVLMDAINIFIDIDCSKFTTKTKLFSHVVPLLLELYHGSRDSNCLLVLTKLLRNTFIFDGCESEIPLWINGILNLKSYDQEVAQNIVEIFKITDHSVKQYLNQLASFTKKEDADICLDVAESFQNLEIDTTIVIKHRYFSPMILGLSKFINEHGFTKSLKTYSTLVLLNLFHMQTDVLPLTNCLKNIELPSDLGDYFISWIECKEIQSIPKVKGKIALTLKQFSETFLTGDITDFLKNDPLDYYAEYSLNLLYTVMCYIGNLLKNNAISKQIAENYTRFVEHLIKNGLFKDSFIHLLLCNPILVSNVTFLALQKEKPQSFANNATVDILKCLIEAKFNVDEYLKMYRKKLLISILKILSKPQKYEEYRINLRNLLSLVRLEYDHCFVIFRNVSELYESFPEKSDIILEILTFALRSFSSICKSNNVLKPFEPEMVKHLSKYLAGLNKHEIETSDICTALCEYLEVFPHDVGNIDHNLFKSIIQRSESNKGSIRVATLLLEKDNKYIDVIKECLDIVCEKKSIILPLVQILVAKNVDDELLLSIFQKIKPVLLKALQKPQKAGQHFHQNYTGTGTILQKFFDSADCVDFVQKVQKFEVSEVFHVHFLSTVYKKVIDENISGKYINNIVLTLIHLQLPVLKRNLTTEEDISKLKQIATIFDNILQNLKLYCSDKGLQSICNNDSFKLYCKYCLKFGIPRQTILLKVLQKLLGNLVDSLDPDYVKLLMDMFVSHSEFLEKMLGEKCDLKEQILKLFLTFCQHWPNLMQRCHLPVLLASYTAMVNRCDMVILTLLKMLVDNSKNEIHLYVTR